MMKQEQYKRRSWSKEEDDLIISSKDTLTTTQIGRILERSGGAVLHRANLLGVKFKFGHRKRNYDEKFFEIPGLLNSFWAGVITTDGCICAKTKSTIIQISEKDSLFLEEFKKNTMFDGNIANVYNHNPKLGNNSNLKRICVGSKQWANDLLINFNIFPDKTKRLTEPPKIKNNYELSLAFLAGAYCGDGTIHVDKDGETIKFCMHSCSFQFLVFIKEFFDKHFHWESYSQKEHTIKESNSVSGFYYYSIFGQRAADIIKCMRKLQLPYLKRKLDHPFLNKKLSKYPVLISNEHLITDISRSQFEVSQISV